VLRTIDNESVDLVLTDPPYVTRYRSKDGRIIINDDRADWLVPAYEQMYRVLRPDSFCITFYGWPTVDLFFAAFRSAGFRPVGHLCFVKDYPSNVGYLRAQHEQAYLLAKGRPPKAPWMRRFSDVRDWEYSGNHFHPTQKAVSILEPLVETFSNPGDVVLDPFCGSGSTLLAAEHLGRRFIGIDIEEQYVKVCRARTQLGIRKQADG
jgi:site-specific DNA-methyltransferase (adenine-specific)